MVQANEDRRFNEQEFALILRRAATLQQGDAARPAGSGLSLPEIESIASEAGIDPAYVRRAAASVTSTSPGLGTRLLGAPARVQHELELASPLDQEGLAAAVEIARAEFGCLGTTREAFDGLEWTARDDYGRTWLAILARGGPPRVVVGTSRTDGAWVLGILLTIGGLLAGSAISAVSGLDPAPLLPVTGAVGGVVAARALWRRTMTRWQGRMQRVLERVSGLASSGEQPR